MDISGILKVAAGVFLTVALILFCVLGYNKFSKMANDQIANAETAMSVNKVYEEFDQRADITGSTVLTFIIEREATKDNKYIEVKTKAGSTVDYLYNNSLAKDSKTDWQSKKKNAMDPTNGAYINPTGTFLAECVYDGDILKGIKFTQK